MRMTVLAAVAAAGLAFVAAPALAAPSLGAAPATAAASIDSTQQARVVVVRKRVVVVRHPHRHCWWRHGVRVCR